MSQYPLGRARPGEVAGDCWRGRRPPKRMEGAADGIFVTLEPACASMVSREDLTRLTMFALEEEGRESPTSIDINIVSDATIHELNRRFLDHDEATDVLTFALDGEDGFVHGAPSILGEIYVSCERAADQCVEWGHDAGQEICFLVVHGVLHLLGWTDATTEERERMLERQAGILRDYSTRDRG